MPSASEPMLRSTRETQARRQRRATTRSSPTRSQNRRTRPLRSSLSPAARCSLRRSRNKLLCDCFCRSQCRASTERLERSSRSAARERRVSSSRSDGASLSSSQLSKRARASMQCLTKRRPRRSNTYARVDARGALRDLQSVGTSALLASPERAATGTSAALSNTTTTKRCKLEENDRSSFTTVAGGSKGIYSGCITSPC